MGMKLITLTLILNGSLIKILISQFMDIKDLVLMNMIQILILINWLMIEIIMQNLIIKTQE